LSKQPDMMAFQQKDWNHLETYFERYRYLPKINEALHVISKLKVGIHCVETGLVGWLCDNDTPTVAYSVLRTLNSLFGFNPDHLRTAFLKIMKIDLLPVEELNFVVTAAKSGRPLSRALCDHYRQFTVNLIAELKALSDQGDVTLVKEDLEILRAAHRIFVQR